MPALPHRTHETSLSDDELLLFDFLFRWRVPEHALAQDAYLIHMNVGYSHALDDLSLRETLDSLARRGLVVSSIEDCKKLWSLTPLGGEQWELERQPQWDLYCENFEKYWRSDRVLYGVLSPDKGTAERCWDAVFRGRVLKSSHSTTRYWRIQRHQLLPWRKFPASHVLVQIGLGATEIDYDRWEANRTWWDSVSELDDLRS